MHSMMEDFLRHLKIMALKSMNVTVVVLFRMCSNEFNERQIHTLKAVINSALESVINNKPLFVTSNSNSEATHDCVREYVSKV